VSVNPKGKLIHLAAFAGIRISLFQSSAAPKSPKLSVLVLCHFLLSSILEILLWKSARSVFCLKCNQVPAIGEKHSKYSWIFLLYEIAEGDGRFQWCMVYRMGRDLRPRITLFELQTGSPAS
jgi:hypothetical protein